ncbi:MAG: hypothetical protein IKQ29_03770 [Bacilli bacterium]|nr:hypothetical protein [Bacilli bacterium]
MKKKNLLLLLAAGLLVTGCGKDSEDSDKKDSKKDSNVATLTCTQQEDDEKMEITVEQDKKTYKLTKVTMEVSLPKSLYEGFADSDEELEKMMCSDQEDSVESCSLKASGDNYVAKIVYNGEKYGEELVEDGTIDKLDADTLEELKKSAEEEGGSCKLSK